MIISHYSPYCTYKLLSTFPELLDNLEYRKIIKNSLSRPDGAYDIYKNVFCLFVFKLIKQLHKTNQEKIRIAFELIEELVNHDCPDVRNVARESFIQLFVDQVKPKNLEKYLGVKSLAIAREISLTFHFSQYCNNKLLSAFPELLDHPDYKKMIEDALAEDALGAGSSSAHTIYESVFFRFVLHLMQQRQSSKESRDKLKVAFDLIEEIANHKDFETRCVVKVSFIEPFTAAMKPMKDVEKYLGPKSLEMARDIAQSLFGRNPDTWEEE